MPLTSLDFFIRATDALIKFDANFSDLQGDNMDIYALEIQASEVKELWAKVKDRCETCLNDLRSADEPSDDEFTSVESKYHVAYKAYVNALSSINRKVDQLRGSPKASVPAQVSNQPATPRVHPPQYEETDSVSGASHHTVTLADVTHISLNDSLTHAINLPPCDIDVFTGDILTWPTFRDFFRLYILVILVLAI